jgi:endonuclease/exonuclease/phosphatase (EEP) superfamily protein YafD
MTRPAPAGVDSNEQRGWFSRLGSAVTALATVALVGMCVVPLVPIWPCPLFEHFRVQFAATGLAVVGCAAALGMRGYFDAAALAALVHVIWIAPDLCSSPGPVPIDGTPIRVLSLNVHTESSSFAEVRRLIEDVRPDVIGLVEVDRRWLDALAPAVAGYAGHLERPRGDNFGVALYARAPLEGSIEELGSPLPSVVARVAVGDARLGILLIHPPPPISSAALAEQVDELDAVADRARQIAGPVVIMGDFNATPWSRPFRRVLARSGLCDSRTGFGIAASFPAASAIVRIPIDHVLASCAIGVRDRHIERDVGSDHLPVVIDLVVPRPRSQPAAGPPG